MPETTCQNQARPSDEKPCARPATTTVVDPATGEEMAVCQECADQVDAAVLMLWQIEEQAKAAASPRQEWTTQQMTEEFETIGFLAPYVVVRRRSDGVKGSLEFTHMPRVYFNWVEDKP